MADNLLQEFSWAVPAAFDSACRKYDFHAADILYSSGSGLRRGHPDGDGMALQVLSARQAGPDAAVRLTLYRGSWQTTQTVETTAERLVCMLRHGSTEHL